MTYRSLRVIAGAAAFAIAVLTPAWAADGPRYTFVEAGYIHTEVDDDGTFGDDPDGDGFELGGSIAVTDLVHLFTSYSDSDLDVDAFGINIDVDYQALTAGAGLNYAVSDTVDLVGRLAYVDAEFDVDVPGFFSASEDESGYALGAGVRAMITEVFELSGAISYVDLDDSDTSFSLGAVYNFTPVVAGAAGISFSDDVTSYGVGLRFYLGDE
jgi:opacity protein-like surface antigen